MDRAESFTLEGDCPSAQLMLVSDEALEEAVCDQTLTPVAIGYPYLRKWPLFPEA